jgi:DNA-binding GntR family transcriptional regulator
MAADDSLVLEQPPFRVLSEHAADRLRRAILAGRYSQGARLVERELAEELSISRAPVRDALRLLSKEGLVRLVPHLGAVVTPVSADLVIDAFSVRAVLEGMAARLAIDNLTPSDMAHLAQLVADIEGAVQAGDAQLLVRLDIEFHQTLTTACRRPILLEALGAIANKTYLLVSLTRSAYPLSQLPEIHALILEAVRSGDPDRVEAAVRDHIALSQQALLSYLSGTPEAQSAGAK